MTADEFKRWRTENGIGMRELARILEVEPSTVARWEAGSRPIPAYMKWAQRGIELARLANAERAPEANDDLGIIDSAEVRP